MFSALMFSIALVSNPSHYRAAVPPGGMTSLVRDYIAEHESIRGTAAFSHAAIPSFARQTGLSCSACHTAFPALNAFGRMFKLNGYTLITQPVIQAGDSGKPETLKLSVIPLVSAMLQTSLSQTKNAPDGTANTNVEFPQQLSLFLGGAITPRIGAFLQLTYAGNDGSIAMDNAEVRYFNQTQLSGKSLGYGLTLNNNPSVQDVWNTVPAWRFPFASSAVAPTPTAAPLLEGALAQQVAGLGAYAMFDGAVYGEVSGYRSAAQGGPHPADSTAMNTVSGVAPYWRAFVQHTWGDKTLMLGTFGMSARLFPAGITGPVNHYTDVAFDGQYESKLGSSIFTARGSWLRETQHLDAALAASEASNATNTLSSLRLDASVITPSRVSMTLGYFSVTGSTDPVLYASQPVFGSANGSPANRGWIGEVAFLPWLNTRLGLQYVAYGTFNGAGKNYDGFGRNASDNNVLYLSAWVAF